jgi:hypothetical protein
MTTEAETSTATVPAIATPFKRRPAVPEEQLDSVHSTVEPLTRNETTSSIEVPLAKVRAWRAPASGFVGEDTNIAPVAKAKNSYRCEASPNRSTGAELDGIV